MTQTVAQKRREVETMRKFDLQVGREEDFREFEGEIVSVIGELLGGYEAYKAVPDDEDETFIPIRYALYLCPDGYRRHVVEDISEHEVDYRLEPGDGSALPEDEARRRWRKLFAAAERREAMPIAVEG